jgi:hypothetical protein
MKKLFWMLSLIAIIGFASVPAHAVQGALDYVPGSKTIVPFWIVDINFAGNDTLITLTETEGVPSGTVFDPPGRLHLQVFSPRSLKVHDEYIPYTKYDVVGISFSTIVKNNFSQASRDICAIDLDNNGVKDHYVGYATLVDYNYDFNHWIGHLYQLDLLGGLSAAAVLPIKEIKWPFNNPCAWLYDTTGDYEAFNADALYSADELVEGALCSQAAWFRLMPRYYIHDQASGKNWIILWQSKNIGGGDPSSPTYSGGWIHVYWYDEEEKVYSSNINIPNELNFIDVAYYLPAGHQGAYPWAGWVDITLPYDLLAPSAWTTAVEMLGYSWQLAEGNAQESWSVLFEVHRDAGTIETVGQ